MLGINAARLLNNLEALAQIGRTPGGGVSRPALSEADLAGRAWFRRQVEAAGLEFRQDGAGNLSARLPATKAGARTLLTGSHLDTVPNGGRFDGALGVLAGLEALQTIQEAAIRPPYHLEAIAFTDEEGTTFSMLGSLALTGRLTLPELEQAQGEAAERLARGLARLGLTPAGVLAARRDPDSLAGFVELHIEQGPRLAEANLQIGVVTAIVGIRNVWLEFGGQAGHSGATPMERRADALWGAAAFVSRARELVVNQFSPGVMNCGYLNLEPGSFNVIPARVRLGLEIRHGSEAELDRLETALLALAAEVARAYGLSLSTEPVPGACVATPMNSRMVRLVELAAADLGLAHTRLLSLAGHDAQNLAPFVPTALFFVPSVAGISHQPAEFTRPEDVVNGANLLLHTLLRLGRVEG